MKVVILAGGMGTRIAEESDVRPKPMIEIGGKPILWHIMKLYHHHGLSEFVICLGYKGYMIKEYFANYFLHMSDVTVDLRNNETIIHNHAVEPWQVTLIDTGAETMTGGRVLRARDHVGDETFCLTYGDGVSDLDIAALTGFHKGHGKAATLTAVQPPGRFGVIRMEGEAVTAFSEKPEGDGAWINGGFFVLEPKVFDYLADDATVWEREPLERLASDGELHAYKHGGYWYAMDTLRDKRLLQGLWESGDAPWKVWE